MKKQIMDRRKKKNIRRAGMITALILLLGGCGVQENATDGGLQVAVQDTGTDTEEIAVP